MSTFALIHGGGDAGWHWHLVARELRRLGHDVVAPDLPCDDDSAGLQDYAEAVIEAIGKRKQLVVVGHSYGGFTAPLVAARVPVDGLVLVAAMVPSPGEAPDDFWTNTGHSRAVRKQAAIDGGLTGHADPHVLYYHDMPRALGERALRHQRPESTTAYYSRGPLKRWPKVPTTYVLCTEDRLFPARYVRRVVAKRLHIVPDEIAAGHYVTLSRPKALSAMLDGYAARFQSLKTARTAASRGLSRSPGRVRPGTPRRGRRVSAGGSRPPGRRRRAGRPRPGSTRLPDSRRR
jgi:pimeloyl-ACP methyl ester carboxylesterase